MRPASALLFDCDGLLVDSETEWLAAVADFGAAHDLALPPRAFVGLTSEHAASRVAAVAGGGGDAAAVTAIEGDLMERYRERLAGGVAAMPGVRALLERVSGRMPLAVVSNGLRRDVEQMLARAGIAVYFDAVLCSDDVRLPKPAPEPYLEAARVLGVPIENCLVFEDSPVGCAAGIAAGAVVVGVSGTAVELPAHHRATSLDALPAVVLDRLPLHPAPAG